MYICICIYIYIYVFSCLGFCLVVGACSLVCCFLRFVFLPWFVFFLLVLMLGVFVCPSHHQVISQDLFGAIFVVNSFNCFFLNFPIFFFCCLMLVLPWGGFERLGLMNFECDLTVVFCLRHLYLCAFSVFSFALGWCLFSSGFSPRLPLGATRVRGALLWLRVGAISACSKGSSVFGKFRTRMILYEFTTAPLSPAISHPFPLFELFACTLGSVKPRG